MASRNRDDKFLGEKKKRGEKKKKHRLGIERRVKRNASIAKEVIILHFLLFSEVVVIWSAAVHTSSSRLVKARAVTWLNPAWGGGGNLWRRKAT